MESVHTRRGGHGPPAQMFNRMLTHFGNERKATPKAPKFDPLKGSYVDSLTKLYSRVYSI